MPPHRDRDIEISKASLIAKRRALLKSLAEDSFHDFVRQAWAIVEPDVEYRDNWHIGALCDHLSAVNDGKIKQLLINVPPGAMKSLLVCVFWPAWVWAKSPAKRFLFASYSDGLTMRDSVRCRNILSSDWYQSNWPIKFKDDQNTKGLFENSQGGWRLSTSVGGKGTGLHPDFVCIPHGVRVLSSAGWLPIGQIVDQRMPVRIASWNHERNCIEWKPILAYEKHVGRPCITIRTSGGRTIECTRNHPIYVPGRGYIPAEEVTVGTELYSVREGVLSKEESEGKILREGVLQSVESAQYGGVPCVQEEIQAGSKTCCEARREDLLLKEVLCNNDSRKWASSLSGRGKAHMRHLWERLSGSHLYAREGKRAVLLSALSGQGNGKACGKQEVPALWETFRRYVVRHKKALFPHLCKQGACGEDRRKGKREVCPWERHRGLQHRVSPVAAEDMGVGRVALCVVREDGQAAYAPHQLRQERRQTGESDDLLQLLPRHTARPSAAEGRVEGDYVTEITGAPTPDHVYNLNVDGNHNYFANGILTHNCADDPNNAREAESEADRQNVIDWWDGTISTRGVSRGVSQIVVQQRLHTMDLTGHLMGKGTWDHICLPMRYEADRMKTTSLGFQDPRNRDGDLLWPALFTGDIVERLEKTMGIHHVAGQLQQRPAPRGGGMFKREWFDVLGYEPQFVRMVRFFDKAGTLGGKGARTAGVLMGRTEKGMFVILDVVKERLGAVEREALIKRMAIVDAQRYDGRVTTYVEQEPGSGGKESAEATVRNLAGFDCRIERVTGAKEVRAEPLAAQASVGNVKLLKGKWNEEFLDEIEVFPVGRLKDQCLVAGTMITTTRGQIPIERVTVEDMVLTGEGFRRVLWAGMTNPAGVVFQMDLSTGGKLVGTANHPVWAIGRGWVDLANTEGAMVLGWCGPHRVERVQMQKLPMAVYNLTIFDVPEYYANDVLVHNCDAASGALNKLCEVSGAFGQVQAEMPAVAMPASETDFVHSDADFSSGDESFFGK